MKKHRSQKSIIDSASTQKIRLVRTLNKHLISKLMILIKAKDLLATSENRLLFKDTEYLEDQF